MTKVTKPCDGLHLIRLIPSVTSLRVFDNSIQANPSEGTSPLPCLFLEIAAKSLVFPRPEQLAATPDWAKPIVLAAYKHFSKQE